MSDSRPFRDNPRLILVGIAILAAALVAMIVLADQSARLSPDYLSEGVLYALSAACLTMLLALGFLLARNIIKLWVERRRAVPFARFRAKLVAAMLGMTLIPAVLVLIVGSELILNSVDRRFSPPIDEVLTSANEIASGYYLEHQAMVSEHAVRIARALSTIDLATDDVSGLRDLVAPEITGQRVSLVEVYSVVADRGPRTEVVPVVEVAAPSLPQGYSRAAADRLAARVANGSEESRTVEPLGNGAQLVRAAVVVRGADEAVAGVVVASSLPHRGASSELTPYYGGLRTVQPGPGAKAATDWRVFIVLPDDHAHDPGQRHLDGSLHCQANNPAGADACRRGA